jgi:hypothetical protein
MPSQITIISFDKTIEDIANYEDLPKVIREEMLGVSLYSSGHQEILGQIGRQIVLSIGGHWRDNKFVAQNYGSKNYQWDGKILKSCHPIYQARYVAFAISKGLTPEKLAATQKNNVDFILWVGDMWQKFFVAHRECDNNYISEECHAKFSSWLLNQEA